MQGTEKGPVLFSTCPNCCLGGESRSFPLGSPHLLWPRSVGRSVALDPSIWSSVSGRYIPRRHNHRLLREQTGGGRGRNTKEGLFAVPRAGRWPPTTTTYIFLGLMGPGHVSGGAGWLARYVPREVEERTVKAFPPLCLPPPPRWRRRGKAITLRKKEKGHLRIEKGGRRGRKELLREQDKFFKRK